MEKLSYKTQNFEGPLDLMLNLISKNKIDILDIKIGDICDQYNAKIDEMQEYQLEIASEFLQMAARLIYIKSESLLPKNHAEELTTELKTELMEYQQCKHLASLISQNANFDLFTRTPSYFKIDMKYDNIYDPKILQYTYSNVLGKSKKNLPPTKEMFSDIVEKKIISVSSRVVLILKNLFKYKKIKFKSLFKRGKQKSELVATFLAVLELVKNNRIKIDENDDLKLI